MGECRHVWVQMSQSLLGRGWRGWRGWRGVKGLAPCCAPPTPTGEWSPTAGKEQNACARTHLSSADQIKKRRRGKWNEWLVFPPSQLAYSADPLTAMFTDSYLSPLSSRDALCQCWRYCSTICSITGSTTRSTDPFRKFWSTFFEHDIREIMYIKMIYRETNNLSIISNTQIRPSFRP